MTGDGFMKKNKRVMSFLILALFLTVVLVITGICCYGFVQRDCYLRLREYTEQMSDEIRQTFENDSKSLEAIAELPGLDDLESENGIKTASRVLSYFKSIGSFSRLEILLPDGRSVMDNGQMLPPDAELPFDEIMEEGEHIGHRSVDVYNKNRHIFRAWVPVVRNGEIKAMLCGVVDVNFMPSLFSSKSYGNNLQLFIFENTNGNLILNTLDNDMVNVYDFGNSHKLVTGEDMLNNLKNGIDGYARLENEGRKYNCCYSMVGIEDWMILITVPRDVAFANADIMLLIFAVFALFTFTAVGVYFLWVLRDIKREKEQRERLLQNVTYMHDVELELFDAHTRPEHFITALHKVTVFANAANSFLWIDGDNVSNSIWTDSNSKKMSMSDELSDSLRKFYEKIESAGFYLSYDSEEIMQNGTSVNSLFGSRINSIMLVPFAELDDEIKGVIGVINMGKEWKSAEPLTLVQYSFAMAINQFRAYTTIYKMGQVDSLTGLKNRNSYSIALDMLSKSSFKSLACVYIDVNGLHEMNNQLGHKAGDNMLKAVADELAYMFPYSDSYRIGGDEFVVLSQNWDRGDMVEKSEKVRRNLHNQDYEISIGIEWRDNNFDITDIINCAEARMQDDKRKFYANAGKNRQIRNTKKYSENVVLQRQDADALLNFLEPNYKSVYFVDIANDVLIDLHVPPEFREQLERAENVYSKAFRFFVDKHVKEEYRENLKELTDFENLRLMLKEAPSIERNYVKNDGEKMKLTIIEFCSYDSKKRKTLWFFSEDKQPE